MKIIVQESMTQAQETCTRFLRTYCPTDVRQADSSCPLQL